jgi:hypothetical protein
MPKRKPRSFSREFKLKAIERLEAGESGTALPRELSVKRAIVYRWREALRALVPPVEYLGKPSNRDQHRINAVPISPVASDGVRFTTESQK